MSFFYGRLVDQHFQMTHCDLKATAETEEAQPRLEISAKGVFLKMSMFRR
jgi:hypothetical protein